MIMFYLGTADSNKAIFPALKMLEELVPVITRKLSGTSLKTFMNEGVVDWEWGIVSKANWMLVLPLLFME